MMVHWGPARARRQVGQTAGEKCGFAKSEIANFPKRDFSNSQFCRFRNCDFPILRFFAFDFFIGQTTRASPDPNESTRHDRRDELGCDVGQPRRCRRYGLLEHAFDKPAVQGRGWVIRDDG
jgi:hypothetical protein